jgi:uncharacterized membrane protein YkgB
MTTTSHPAAPTTPEQKPSADARADAAEFAERVHSTQATLASAFMNALINRLTKVGLLTEDLDYHVVRASMVLIFVFFGYQKWWDYEAQVLIPYISNGPLIFWMYPVFGIWGASWFLGVSEWVFGALLFAGFWNKPLGILGALGSCFSFIATVTIIPFMPDGWAASAGGFPAMTGNVPFLMKDVVLFAASVYLLKQDVVRVSLLASPMISTPKVGRGERSTPQMPRTAEEACCAVANRESQLH